MLTWKEHYRKTFFLAYPVCLSQMGHILVGVADTAMVGLIGTPEQAAVALANSLYAIVLTFGIGIAFGITPLVAAADAKGDTLEAVTLFKNGIVVNLITGIILFSLLYSASDLLSHLDQQENVSGMAIPFFNVLVLSMIPLSFFMSFKQFAEGLSDTKVAMVVSILANVLNVVLNYLMIFGKFGFPEMGLMGSCWASFISRVVMAVVMLIYILKKRSYRKYREQWKIAVLSNRTVRSILNIGIPSGLQYVFEVGAFSFAAVMIGWIGAKELAANQIALSIAALTYMMANGISAAASVRVGNQFGLKDLLELKRSAIAAVIMVIIIMGGAGILLVLLRSSIPLWFTQSAEVMSVASSLLLIAAFFQLSDGLQTVALGVLRGIQDVRIPTAIALFAYWIIALPLGYYFTFRLKMGVEGIWYGLLAGLSMAAILLLIRINYITKRIFLKGHPEIT